MLGFRMEGMELLREYPKSVVTMAPHTAYREAIYGKWALQAAGVKYVFCSKNEYFSGPMKLAMRYIGAMPVRNVPGKNSIFEVTKLLQNKQLHVVICPEGGFAPTHTWQDGFYYMACRANVPILVGAIFGAILKYAFQSVLWFVLGIVVGGIASYFYIKFKRNRLPGTLHHMLFCFTGVVPLNSNYKNGFIQRVNE